MTVAEYDAQWRLTEAEEEELRSIRGRRSFCAGLQDVDVSRGTVRAEEVVSNGVITAEGHWVL